MPAKSLKQRVADLEHEVAALKTSLATAGKVEDWRRTVGMFDNDATMQEIDRLTLKVREDDRKKARRRQARPKPIKP
jgi:hypothetical protein